MNGLILCLGMLAGILILTLFSVWTDSKRFAVRTYEITDAKFHFKEQDQHRILLLADLHNKVYGKNNNILLKKIEELHPEFIIVAGDMLVAKPGYDMTPAISFMERLAKTHRVYYANGNHEYRLRIYPDVYGNMSQVYTRKLKNAGVHLLQNTYERVSLDQTEFKIYGLEIDRRYYHRFENRQMEAKEVRRLLGSADKEAVNLLIAHNPKHFPAYAGWGADLVCSGHVHGGIMRLPLLGGVISPQLRLFPKYDGGLFEEGKSKMVLSRGLGTHTIPLRIFNPAEIVVIDMKNPENRESTERNKNGNFSKAGSV